MINKDLEPTGSPPPLRPLPPDSDDSDDDDNFENEVNNGNRYKYKFTKV